MKQFQFFICFTCFCSIYTLAQESVIDSLELLHKNNNDNEKYYDIAFQLSDSYYNIGNHKQCYKYAIRAYDYAKETKQIAEASSYIALSGLLLGKLDTAEQFCKDAAALYTKLDNDQELAQVYKYMGDIFYKKNIPDSAILYYKQSIAIYSKPSVDITKAGKLYYQLALVLRKKADYISAISYLNEGVEISKKANNIKDIGRCYMLKAGIYVSLMQPKKALIEYDMAEKYFKQINYGIAITIIDHNRAQIYKDLNQYSKALEHALISLTEFRKNNLNQYSIISYNLIGSILVSNNQPAEAISYLDSSYNLIDKNSNSPELLKYYLHSSKAYYELNQYNKASLNIEKSMEMAIDMGQQYTTSEIWFVAAKIYSKLEKNEKAVEYIDLYKVYNDSLINVETISKFEELEVKYQTNLKNQEIERLSYEKAQQELTLRSERRNRMLITSIAVLITVLGAGSTLIYRIRQKQKRTDLARTKAEVENRLLRVQMNPHFMFNSLNSVQSYIASNQNQLAEDYLARFAQLTRSILNNSREDFVTVDNEIDTLKTYLELEQQRFNHAFDFSITIDKELDEEVLKVPPMLIQPFVENAIIHGVAPLKKEGIISLDFLLLETTNSIQCTIIDNGIGRNESAKINKGSKHKSLGLKVTQERFKLIKQQTNAPVKVNIYDLDKGTKVELQIPFIGN